MTNEDIINMMIKNAEAAIRNAQDLYLTLPMGSIEYNTAWQIIRDNRRYIDDQKWTLSVINGTKEG